MCGNGVCYETKELCPYVKKWCFSAKTPYSCDNGKCLPSNRQCDKYWNEKDIKTGNFLKNKACKDSKYWRCVDGYCRTSCGKVKSSACPLSMPWNCGNGACKSSFSSCTAGSYCESTKPFVCPNMDCKKSLVDCKIGYAFRYSSKPIIFKFNVADIQNTNPDKVKYHGERTDTANEGGFIFEASANAKSFYPNRLNTVFFQELPNKNSQNLSSKWEVQKPIKNAVIHIKTLPASDIYDVTNDFTKKWFYQIQEYFKINPEDVVSGTAKKYYDCPRH